MWDTIIHRPHLPTLDLQNGILRAWWIDPLIATLSFWVIINIYWNEERKRGLSACKTYKQWFGWVKGDLGGQLFLSQISYWLGILVWKAFVPPPTGPMPDGIPHDLPSLLYLVVESASGIVLYDAIFFFIHWAMHELRPLRCVHIRHHSFRPEGTLEARDILRHSLVDGSLQVLVNIAVQRRTPWGAVKSRLARAVHNVVVCWMLTESHTASPTPNVFRRWFVGVREHRLHHLGVEQHGDFGRHHRYQQFFGYLDDVRSWWMVHSKNRDLSTVTKYE